MSPNDAHRFAPFLRLSAAVTVAGALLVALFVVVVDPYHLFGLLTVEGFNRVKPAPERYQEEIKVAQARAMGANALFLGNSRIEVGLDPENPGVAMHGYAAYNLALSGTGLSTARRTLERLRAGGRRPAMVVYGVEFLEFLLDPAAPPPTPARPAPAQQWRVDTVFSLTSALDALTTLRIQHSPEAPTMTARGFNPLLEYRKYVRESGYFPIFEQRAHEYAASLAHKPHGLLRTATGNSTDLEALRALLTTLAGDGTAVNLVIYPYHAQMLAMFEQAGLWSSFEAWKRLLVREIEAVRSRYPGARIALWDFSGYSAYQCERIPARGDNRSASAWYWEAGHFKSALGDRMLSRMLGGVAQARSGDNFGYPLEAAGLASNQARIEAERGSCAAAYPELFSDAARMIAAARSAPR